MMKSLAPLLAYNSGGSRIPSCNVVGGKVCSGGENNKLRVTTVHNRDFLKRCETHCGPQLFVRFLRDHGDVVVVVTYCEVCDILSMNAGSSPS